MKLNEFIIELQRITNGQVHDSNHPGTDVVVRVEHVAGYAMPGAAYHIHSVSLIDGRAEISMYPEHEVA